MLGLEDVDEACMACLDGLVITIMRVCRIDFLFFFFLTAFLDGWLCVDNA